MLTDIDVERYKRQLLLNEFGEDGQKLLFDGSVLVIGIGGLGSPAAYYLAAAGVGRLGLLDSDAVELSNLQRQILHFTSDVGKLKVDSAQQKLLALNPGIIVDTHHVRLTNGNIKKISMNYDVVISAVDNFETKYLINDYCVKYKKAFVHAGILGWQGQVFTYAPEQLSACLRCLKENPPAKEKLFYPMPVLGSVAGTLGIIQATECIKYITGKGKLLTNRLLVHDALQMKFNEIMFVKRSDCLCGADYQEI